MTLAINKYLETFAEQETSLLQGFPADHSYKQCIVVPVYNETTAFAERLASSALATGTLLIVVINQADNNLNIAKNHQFFRQLQSIGQTLWKHRNLSLIQANALHILTVDRYTENKIPHNEGVGRARKIGCDLAVELFRRNLLRYPVIYSTDADAHLPANYFQFNQQMDQHTSARVFEFQHMVDDSTTGRATRAYELAIKYYKAGLEWAGSPYAFYTLGSAVAVNMLHYCLVRGFPKRAAAEDFYLVNKLAKVGTIRSTSEITIHIDARLSDRVPFGTGPAVRKIIDLWEKGEDYLYYHPESFVQLKSWLECQPSLAQTLLNEKTNPLKTISDKLLGEAAQAMDFTRFIDHAKKQCSSQQAYLQHFHNWFDGFRTLKFIHFMQAHHFPAKKLEDCLAQAERLFRKTD